MERGKGKVEEVAEKESKERMRKGCRRMGEGKRKKLKERGDREGK